MTTTTPSEPDRSARHTPRLARHAAVWAALYVAWLLATRDFHPTWAVALSATAVLVGASAVAVYGTTWGATRTRQRGLLASVALIVGMLVAADLLCVSLIQALYDGLWHPDPRRFGFWFNMASDGAIITLHVLLAAALRRLTRRHTATLSCLTLFGGTPLATPALSHAQPFLRPADVNALPSKAPDAVIAYGTDSLQFGELRLPSGTGPFAVAIVIHGGCWVHDYAAAKNAAALSDALRDAGVATWNVEYRRRDNPGGGWPGTITDVGAAADSLRAIARRYPLDLTHVVAVGHSAGGQLALWLAARKQLPASSALHAPAPLPLTGVVALGGPGDLVDFNRYGDAACGEGTIPKLLGGTAEQVPDRWRDASPVNWLPLGVPQVMLAGESDRIMPRANLEAYAAKARAAGDRVDVVVVPKAAHHEVMSPQAVTWPAVREAVLRLVGR
ncbi:MAG: alpha/beta hydrolase [Gemmatimonadaceae bacterium]|nr:alpha/beta hydrolase [Gemmatimonadaceae bacterium]